jgi:Phosphotransferase enzyme family
VAAAAEALQDAITGGGPGPAHATLASGFGEYLEPVLLQACAGRLTNLHWFRTDWQRGGALTGYATFRDGDGAAHDAVVKLPVPPGERQWLIRLQQAGDVAPQLLAEGQALGEYDLAWVVMERLPHGPIGAAWGGGGIDLVIEAVGRFYAAAAGVPLQGSARLRDWHAVQKQARENVRKHSLAHEQRWTTALKKAHRKLKDWLAVWDGRALDQWCHGDLHSANALTRQPPPDGPAVLIDYAETHPCHWLEDALYLEHLYWGRPQRLDGRRICKQIAHERKRHGLAVEPDWSHLASVGRGLFAMATPAMLEHEGDPVHVEAALQILEQEAG